MSSSMKEPQNLQHLTLCIMAEIFCIFGVLINAFIVAVNLIDWLKKKALTHVDQIITFLGMTSLCSQAASFLYILSSMFYNSESSFLSFYVINKVGVFFTVSSSWLMTLLSVVFCLKISSFHHILLLRLKNVVSQKVAHFIAASVLISFCYILLLIWVEYIEIPKYIMHNMTNDNTGTPHSNVTLLLLILLSSSVPFILYCTSSALVIVSLSFHIHRMNRNTTPTSNLEKYYNVIKIMSLSVMYYILNATVFVTVIYYHHFYSLEFIWVHITIHTFPNLHSMYLIHRTNKLRDRLWSILQYGTNCLLNRRPNDLRSRNPGESIMQ